MTKNPIHFFFLVALTLYYLAGPETDSIRVFCADLVRDLFQYIIVTRTKTVYRFQQVNVEF